MKTALLVLGLFGFLLVGNSIVQAESVKQIVSAMCTKVEAAVIRRDRGATREETVIWLIANANLARDNAEQVAKLAYDSYSKDSPSEAYSECMEVVGE